MIVLGLAFAALAISSAAKSPPPDQSVPIHKDWTLTHARNVLIRHGWKPAHPLALIHSYPELETCSTAGCVFAYKKAGRCLSVQANGKPEPRVTWWWTHDCPSN